MNTPTATIQAAARYVTRSICDSNCFFELFVIKRTAKTATIRYNGEIRRTKIKTDCSGIEYLRPDDYSMAPIFSAERAA
jgi:hypothetical protein